MFGTNVFPPSLQQLAPSAVPVNSTPFFMTVTGTNFAPGAIVFWNETPQGTRFVNSKELLVSITDVDLSQFGVAQVFVRSGGLTSNTVGFNVTAQ
jgi:hypothetical protein